MGFQKFLRLLLLYLLIIGLTVFIAYEIVGKSINPHISLKRLFELSQHERQSIRAGPHRLNWPHYRNVSLQALVYSIGGLYLPCGDRMCDRQWTNEEAYRSYFYYTRGVLFLIGYAILGLAILGNFILRKIWLSETVLWVILLWIFIYISFFVYFNPWAGPVYGAELMPPFWGFVIISLCRSRSKKIYIFLFIFAVILFWNNYHVIRFFRWHYRSDKSQRKVPALFNNQPAPPSYQPGGV